MALPPFLIENLGDFIMNELTATTIYFGRHGATELNSQGRIQGGNSKGPKSELTEEGYAQAKKLGQMMVEHFPQVSAFYSSTLKRSRDTAQLVSESYQYLNVKNEIVREYDVKKNPHFDEIRHRTHEGVLSKARNDYAASYYEQQELKEREMGRTPGRYFKWETTPFSGAETCLELLNRVTSGMEQVAKKCPGKEIFVGSHGAVISTLITEYGTPQDDESPLPLYYEKPSIPHCAVAVFECRPDAEFSRDKIKFIQMIDFLSEDKEKKTKSLLNL
jgi:broad specificity phosphatase PhoE